MQRDYSPGLPGSAGCAGWLKLGLILLAALAVNVGRAQTNFANALNLGMGVYGTVVNNNSSSIPDIGAPNIAGYLPQHPLWYVWTAPQSGDVDVDTLGSVTTNISSSISEESGILYLTNMINIDTVLGVYQGNGSSPKNLNQIAANDDMYPINSSLGLYGYLISPLPDEPGFAPDEIAEYAYIPGYYGPSHLRFTAQANQTYYFAVDGKYGQTGNISLSWAYESSGVFRFASEDQDWLTDLPLYQTAETESRPPEGNGNVDVDSVVQTYYDYNAQGVLVTVTRSAGSSGRAIVGYQTIDGTNLPAISPSDTPGIAGVDYEPVSGQLVFDDFEMSKTILIPIYYEGIRTLKETNITSTEGVMFTNVFVIGDESNRVFGIQLSSPQLDPNENSAAVSPPRVDPVFSTAVVKILNTDGDPYGPDVVPFVTTNISTEYEFTNIITNSVFAEAPTNNIFNFEKANYRVPADVNDTNISPYGYVQVALYVLRGGTNRSAETFNYKVDAELDDDGTVTEYFDDYPLQPASDYAVPLPANQNTVIRNYPTSVYDGVTTNYDFNVADGTVNFPGNGAGSIAQPIHITIPVSMATKFNKDFRISLYREVSVNGNNVPELTGMNAQATVTILFNDQNPPAGSVDEFYNADFSSPAEMATFPPLVPPSAGPVPGVGSPSYPGLVYAVAVLTNDEALIGGDFSTYNGASRNGVALVKTNGQVDTSFSPSSGVGGDLSNQGNDASVNAVAISGNHYYIGGNFTAFNNTLASGIARVNANGSLDTTFNAGGSGADNVVRALVQQTDGKIVIGGDFTHVNGIPCDYIARLNSNGTVDAAFAPSNTLAGPVYSLALAPSSVLSISRSAVSTNEDDQPFNLGTLTAGTLNVNYNMSFRPDDMRIFYGDTNVNAGTGVLIYDTGGVAGTGSLSLPFGPIGGANGLLTTNLITIVMNQGGNLATNNAWSYTASITVQGSGDIVVGGNFGVTGQAFTNIAFLTTNGTLDTTFSPVSGPNGIVHSLGWELNNQIVAGGEFTAVSGLSENYIARFNPDGSLDTTNFFAGAGADQSVFNVTLDELTGLIYIGGDFREFNGTHRAGFARLYPNGTLDTTFMDTAYDQFAGLKKIFAGDSPAVYASALQENGGVLIGGSFVQVGGGQADRYAVDTLDEDLYLPDIGSFDSFADPNLWVEPKVRDGVRNRIGFARLIGGSTAGPGNIGLDQTSYSQEKSISSLTVPLVRTNGTLGPISANFIVQPGLTPQSVAQPGQDYTYQAGPPLYWIAWNYLELLSRMREDGLWGVSGNSLLIDPFGTSLSSADATINNLASVSVGVIANPSNPGDLDAQFQLANPSLDTFYLGGEEIPLGAALGVSSAQMSFNDDTTYPGQVGFASSSYIATNSSAVIAMVRSNGTYGAVSMRFWATNGTAIGGVDYRGVTNELLTFNTSITSLNADVTVLNNGTVTNVEKTVNMRLSTLGLTPGATFGISNAVLRIINPGFQGYVQLASASFSGTTVSGVLNFVVNRVAGSLGAISVQYATTNGPSAYNGVDFTGSTNTLTWASGDVSPRTISIPLLTTQVVGGGNKQFGVYLLNAATGVNPTPSLMGVITNASLIINNNNSYGALQFSSPAYLVDEFTNNYALLTVIRTGGLSGTDTVNAVTSNGSNTIAGVNYYPTNVLLTFPPNQIAQSFQVYIKPNGVPDPVPADFYFNVTLSNVVNATLAAPTNAQVRIVDTVFNTFPPGSPDTTFTTSGMNGDVLALSLNSSGQILAGGNFTAVGPTAEGHLARLNTDGSLDTGFLNGMAGANAAVNAVVCQTTLSDADRVLIGGDFTTFTTANTTYSRNSIARLMTDGSVDTSFNPGAGADNVVNAVAEAFSLNGTSLTREIYIGGAFDYFNGNQSPCVERLNNEGAVDYSFNVGVGANAPVYAIAVYPTNSIYWGKVLIGGAFNTFNGYNVGYIARLNVDGSMDTNFAANLAVGAGNTVRAIAIQSDDRVLVGGDFTNFDGTNLNYIARLNANGTLDTSFAAGPGTGAGNSVDAIVLQADNRIILGGQFIQAGGITRNRITRLLPTGAMDPTINFGDGANGAVDAVLIQPADQKILIGGGFTEYDDQTANYIARIYGGSETGSGAFTFTSSAYQVNENGVQAVIGVSRTGGTSGTNADGSGDVFVTFATSNGTATNGINYSGETNILDFPPGEVTENVTVPVLNTSNITPNLTVNLALSNPTPPASLGIQSTAVLTILNVNNAVAFGSPGYSYPKTAGIGTIDVARIGTAGSCSVYLMTTTNGTAVPGVDFEPTNLTVNFGPNQTDVQVQVPILDNTNSSGTSTVIFALTNAANAFIYAPSNATLTITDNSTNAGQFSFGAINFTAYASAGGGNLTVIRTNGSYGSATVYFSTIPGTAKPGVDYTTVNNGPVNFNSGQTSATATVPLLNNNMTIAPVSLSVVLSSLPGNAALAAPTNATLTIINTNSIVAFALATNTFNETAGMVFITVNRYNNTNLTTSVNYATANGTAFAVTNYVATSGVLTFNPGQTVATIPVTLVHDTNVTGTLVFNLNLSNPNNGLLAAPSTTVIQELDAEAGLSFTNSVSSVNKNVGNGAVKVVCSNPGVEPVSVNYSTADGTGKAGINYVATSGTLTFVNGIGTTNFYVPIIDNTLVSGNYTFVVNLLNPTTPGKLVPPSTQTITIVDNNSGLSFSSPTYTVNRSAGSITITVVRTDNVNTTSSVNFTTSDGTATAGVDYEATSGTLTFTPGQTTQTFLITIIASTTVQPDKTVLLQLTSPVNGELIAPSAATLTIHDTIGSYVVPAGSTFAPGDTNMTGIIEPGETVSLLFGFRAAGGTNVANLIATLQATNGITAPTSSNGTPAQSYGPLIVNGPSAFRQFTFTAVGTNSQQIVATFLLNNGVTNIGTALFTYTLGSWTTSFSNTNMIVINANTNATPYPSIITVSNVGGILIKATVTLSSLSHSSPQDIGALVVSPAQNDTLIMGNAGSIDAVNNLIITFDDAATNSLPQNSAITNGTYKPTVYFTVPTFP